MPNYVTILLKVSGKADRVQEFVNQHLTTREVEYPAHSPKAGQKYIETLNLDFNADVPEDRRNLDYRIYPDATGWTGIQKEDERVDVNGRKHYFDWYKFHLEKWGTKWNAESKKAEIEDLGDGNAVATYDFDTASNYPEPWFLAVVAKWPDLKFQSWATEESHSFYAIATGENGNGEVQMLDYDENFLDREKFETVLKETMKGLGLDPDSYRIDEIDSYGSELGAYFYLNIQEDLENPSKSTYLIDMYDQEKFIEKLNESYKKC